ncbi:MAG: ferredoxin family protein [Candidatus Helarchaeota archaeon]|nr:ferredoxin family protein [Candidatus Helarchaeota archaeon]
MKIIIEENLCKGCGFCIEVCPEHIFKESDNLNKKGYTQPEIVNPDSCIFCKKCELICPEMAISVEKEEEGK